MTTTGERSNIVIIREETSAMPLLKNKEALKIQPLQIELTIRNHNNQSPPGLAAGSLKLVMVKPPRDDSDDQTKSKNWL